MIFVHSRKGTGATARALAEHAVMEGGLEGMFIPGEYDDNDARTRYIDKAEKSWNRELAKHFLNGMGYVLAGR